MSFSGPYPNPAAVSITTRQRSALALATSTPVNVPGLVTNPRTPENPTIYPVSPHPRGRMATFPGPIPYPIVKAAEDKEDEDEDSEHLEHADNAGPHAPALALALGENPAPPPVLWKRIPPAIPVVAVVEAVVEALQAEALLVLRALEVLLNLMNNSSWIPFGLSMM
ncbi:hypothetical protein C8R44DRAFT_874715 [Mycena epipterygia]|nr:hypothetical protein C8R44DRAFT_874715 [Mycena epipterygia]